MKQQHGVCKSLRSRIRWKNRAESSQYFHREAWGSGDTMGEAMTDQRQGNE